MDRRYKNCSLDSDVSSVQVRGRISVDNLVLGYFTSTDKYLYSFRFFLYARTFMTIFLALVLLYFSIRFYFNVQTF